MYCDYSAYYQKAIKATARQLKNYTNLLWFFLLFGRLIQAVSNTCICFSVGFSSQEYSIV